MLTKFYHLSEIYLQTNSLATLWQNFPTGNYNNFCLCSSLYYVDKLGDVDGILAQVDGIKYLSQLEDSMTPLPPA